MEFTFVPDKGIREERSGNWCSQSGEGEREAGHLGLRFLQSNKNRLHSLLLPSSGKAALRVPGRLPGEKEHLSFNLV